MQPHPFISSKRGGGKEEGRARGWRVKWDKGNIKNLISLIVGAIKLCGAESAICVFLWSSAIH